MNAVRKTRLSVALGVVLGVSAIVPATSYGFSVDLNTNSIAVPGAGDSVIYPFYTTVNGATTSYSLTNTSSEQTIAAKVRFREQKYSFDVLDFIVFLSPNDKFDFFISADPAVNQGRPVVSWNDNSCVTGVLNTPNQTKRLLMPAVEAGRKIVDADLAVGHVEVIGMINLQGLQDRANVDLDVVVRHNDDGIPLACNVALEAFRTRANVNAIRLEGRPIGGDIGLLARQDVENALVGAHVITIPGGGIEAGEDAIHVRNTFNRGFLAAQSPQLCTLVNNGVNQGTDGCSSLYTWDTKEENHPHLGDINWVSRDLPGQEPIGRNNTVARMDGLLTASVSLQGDWSNNPTNNVGFDWITTFPTKYVYIDQDCSPIQDWEFVNVGNRVVGERPKCTTPTPFGFNGDDNCIISAPGEDIGTVFNTEERRDTLFSPSNADLFDFCNETTVYTFAEPGQVIQPSLLQTAAQRVILEFNQTGTIPGNRGWAEVYFNWVSNRIIPTHATNVRDGAATAGLLFLLRSTDDPTINNGSLRELNRNTGELRAIFDDVPNGN
ncbi:MULTISPECIES: hypothetical protein [unclassified Thiocapsa]|uniref:hypothetical protein n=1 Tax=unclassified Thiocapsa TaxID=2641286 RepID=UPI0035B237A1